MNIVLQELKMSFRSFFWYTISMLLTFYIFLSLFHVIASDAAILDELLSNFPAEFKAAFGFADINLSELNGYLSFLFTYIVLIGAIFGMKLGVSSLSEEIRVKTADFLLTKPVRRTSIATFKLISILIQVIAQNLLFFLLSLLPIYLFFYNDSFSFKIFTLMSLSVLLVQLFFIGFGLFLSVIIPKIKAVMPITLGVVFLFFIIEMINQSVMDKKLTYLSPFSYFRGSDMISLGHYEPVYVILVCAVFVVFGLSGFYLYHRKDMPSV